MTEKSDRLACILTKIPSLKNLLDQHGHTTLFDYAREYYTGHTPSEKKDEFLMLLYRYVEKKMGPEPAGKIVESLEKNYAVSTAEHMGPIGHPFFFQSTILRGLIQPQEAIVHLCTNHVSLGNSSYPRGFTFQSDAQENTTLHLPLFTADHRMHPVFGHPPFTEQDKNRALELLKKQKNKGLITGEKYHTLSTWIEKRLPLDIGSYPEQITQINQYLWNDLFHEIFPPFYTLNAEEFVNELLVYHIQNGYNGSLFFEQKEQEKIESLFDGISCCFDIKEQKGSYLFWFKNEHHTRCALWRKKDMLVGGGIQLPLQKETILEYIQSGCLIPSGLLIYSILSGHYGLTCFGGFAQGGYLPRLLFAYNQWLGTTTQISSSILCEDMVFSYTKNKSIATALDMLHEGELTSKNVLLEKAKTTTLLDSLEAMVPEIGRCLSC